MPGETVVGELNRRIRRELKHKIGPAFVQIGELRIHRGTSNYSLERHGPTPDKRRTIYQGIWATDTMLGVTELSLVHWALKVLRKHQILADLANV